MLPDKCFSVTYMGSPDRFEPTPRRILSPAAIASSIRRRLMGRSQESGQDFAKSDLAPINHQRASRPGEIKYPRRSAIIIDGHNELEPAD